MRHTNKNKFTFKIGCVCPVTAFNIDAGSKPNGMQQGFITDETKTNIRTRK